MRTLPSLASLRAFETVARLRSMSRAAEELGVTQGAVSRAIQALEKDLGTLLFRRSRPLLQLTEAGEVLRVDVKRGFERLSAGVERVRELGQSGRLAIDVLPTFAIRFLIPRLPRLQALHPEFDVDLTVSERMVDFDVDPIDIAIRYGMDGQWPHAGSTRLMEEELVFVCAPAVRGRYGALTPDMLEPQLLLRHTTRPETWPEWFAAAGPAHSERRARRRRFSRLLARSPGCPSAHCAQLRRSLCPTSQADSWCSAKEWPDQAHSSTAARRVGLPFRD